MRKTLFFLILLLSLFCTNSFAELVRQKNVATVVEFEIFKNDGTLLSGAAGLDSEIDAYTDGSAPDGWTDCTNEATEIGSTGHYYLSLTQAEMNADYVRIQVKSSSTGAVTRSINIRTMTGDPLLFATTDDGGVINVTAGAIDTVTTTTGVTTVNGIANNAITAAAINSGAITNAKFASGAIDAAAIAADAGTEIGTAVWATAARTLTEIDEDNTTIDLNSSTVGGLTTWDKTGYSLSSSQTFNITGNISGSVGSVTGSVGSISGVTFPTNFSALSISATTGLVDITQVAADKVWATAARQLTGTQTFNLTGNITGNLSGTVGSVTAGVSLSSGAVDDIWNEVQSGHTTAGTFGKYLDAQISAIGSGGGEGADWSVNEKAEIKTILGITGTGTPTSKPSDGVLKRVYKQTDLIGH